MSFEIAPQPPVAAAAPDRALRQTVAKRLLASGDYPGAEVVLSALLRDDPADGDAAFLLAVTIQKQSRYADARARLESLLASDAQFSSRPHAHHFLGWACWHLGAVDAAEEAFAEHVRLAPGAADSWYALGLCAMERDDLALARERFARALALADAAGGPQERAKIVAAQGDIALREGQEEEAERLFETSAGLWPDHASVWDRLARVRWALGQEREAESAEAEAANARERKAQP